MTYDEITKVFYNQLDECIRETPKEDQLIIMGNLNARVGTNHDAWQGTLGLHGIGKCNSNGLLLLTKCMEHELATTNTFFKQPMKNEPTWMHPRSKKWHLIDYIICRNQDLTNVKITKTVRGTNCETDHHMVFCKMKCIIQPPRKKTATTKPNRKFDIARLKQTAVMEDFSNALNTALENQPVIDNEFPTVTTAWTTTRDMAYGIAESKIGFAKKKQRDWFNENIEEMNQLLEEKNTLHKKWLSCGTRSTQLATSALELKLAVDQNDTKRFYELTKDLYGPSTQSSAPLLSKDGTTLIRNQKARMERWKEHYSDLLNQSSEVNEDMLSNIEQCEVMEYLAAPLNSSRG